MTVALIGAGRMGGFLARQLPAAMDRTVIDTDVGKARALAEPLGARWGETPADAAVADIILLALPAQAVASAAADAAKAAKPGAYIVNMATNGTVPPQLFEAYPAIRFLDAKIIGHAGAMEQGAAGIVVVGTDDPAVLALVRSVLPGFSEVAMGDPALVPALNTVGSTEGIRAAVHCRKLLGSYPIPKSWADAVIATVAAGTLRAYVADDLGDFARALTERLEAEEPPKQ